MTKRIKNINFIQSKNSSRKKFNNRPQARLGRINPKDKKQNFIKDTHYLYAQNSMLNSIIDKNFLFENANKANNRKLENINSFSFKEKQKLRIKKRNLNFNKLNNILNKEKNIIYKQINSPNSFNKKSLKTISAKIRDINIEKNNLFSQKNITQKNIFDNIKIKNIISLWNELEVMNPYRKYFCFIFKELNEEEQENLYQHEIKELIELKNNIKNLTYNIELRIGIIKKLSELNSELNKEKKNNNKKVNNFIINEMTKEIEKLTEQTINIVLYMKKMKEGIYAVSNLGKYNIDIITEKFHFDKNYIIKMKAETNFLWEGSAKDYFNIKNDESPFFMTAFEKNINNLKNEPFKQSIELNENQINDIKECNYYIYKELIAYQNEKANKKVFRCISPLRKNNSAYNYENINFYNNNYFIIKDDKKENENEKIELIINGSGGEINNDNNNHRIEIKRNSKSNIHNSVKLVTPGTDLYSLDSNINRKNKKMYTFNQISNNNNIKNIKNNKKYRNSDILLFQNNFENNKKYNQILNDSRHDLNLDNNPVFENSQKENDNHSLSHSNESKKDEDQKQEEDLKEK